MKNQKPDLNWNAVSIGEDLQTLGLAGFEELTEYDGNIIQTAWYANNERNLKKKKKRRKKKKPVQTDNSDNIAKTSKRKDRDGDLSQLASSKKIKYEATQQSCSDAGSSEKIAIKDGGNIYEGIMEGMEAWHGLNVPTQIIQALSELKFTKPTTIQSMALPPAILGKRDILGAAETGSGKTLAFGIPIISGILECKRRDSEAQESNGDISKCDSISQEKSGGKLYALVLTPTRELAIQVRNHLVAVAKYTGIKVSVVVGGLSAEKQERLLRKCPDIVVATPGRLWELIQEGNPHLSQVDDIRYLAIDETDRMLERGHYEELQKLLERINLDEGRKSSRQNFVFSATLTLVHEPPRHLKGQARKRLTPGQKLQGIISLLGITNPKVVDITQEKGTAGTLLESRICCTLEEKDEYLYYLLQRHPGRTLVFCNSISCVRRLTQLLQLLQCNPLPLHANMVQRQRLKNLDRFRNDPNSVLLATDVAARGLDIPGVEHVIHYQVPRTSEGYIHRSGRTARVEKEGLTILLIDPSEVSYYARLCRTLGRDKDLPLFPVDDSLFKGVKERVHLARELDKLELTCRRHHAKNNWFHKAIKDMDLVLDENEMPSGLSRETAVEIKRVASLKRKQLNTLLSKPIFPRGFSGKYPTKTGQLQVPFVKATVPEVAAVKVFQEVQKSKKHITVRKPGMFVLLKNKGRNYSKKK
ncbi:ATP-dependent RNA helicase DDX24 isoform X1 [Schistocerca americana]|uniref:ATP-dependent RNA helicase DDX24 isoform X1 n=1 Tax=Schistocerca americana TaxID=7009 RepID=UPI001F4F4A7F|nr:ATP-dependent RNA helicase DDX24 isoform X1 [Schistocerca americana]XP_049940515.1 ATP-dependent RNA helicase DDX24 isoform X1 [Schistocerca serialis cubense]